MHIKQMVHGFLVIIGPSIYTNRKGRVDIRILENSDWGAKHDNGYRYKTRKVIAAENLENIRDYAPIQGNVMDEILDFAHGLLTQTSDMEVVA